MLKSTIEGLGISTQGLVYDDNKIILFNTRDVVLVFRVKFGLKIPIPISGNVQLEIPILALKFLGRMAIAFIVRGQITLLIFLVLKRIIQFRFHKLWKYTLKAFFRSAYTSATLLLMFF